MTYLVKYQTYLEGSPNESLQYSDSIINVKFDTEPNGIFFNIENLTKNNLYLIWDKSYFIEPNGSSSKPLNTDVLETTSSIREKENYESVLPQRGHFERFTCSSMNISQFHTYNSVTIYNELTHSINTYSDYNKFYRTGNYWDLGVTIPYSSKSEISRMNKTQISNIQKYILNNDNLSMGFTIRNKNKEIEYHFKFPIKSVVIFSKSGQDIPYEKISELKKDNGFKSISDNSQGSIKSQDPIQQGDSYIVTCVNCKKEFKVSGISKGDVKCPFCGTQNTIVGK